MTQHWFRLYVQRIDATRNMARFYEMSIEPDLFGGSALVRRRGRMVRAVKSASICLRMTVKR
jgi:predicted DNA-binding WGR domain protein